MAPLSFHVDALLPSSIAPKLDSILHSHVYPQVAGVLRAVTRFKALLLHAILDLNNNNSNRTAGGGKKNRRRRSKIAGFVVKLHFFSTARAARRADLPDAGCSCYVDECSAWSAVAPAAEAAGGTAAECGYLCWLEEEEERPAAAEEGQHGAGAGDDDNDEESAAVNEIDRLAEKFIARFHAKCLLEKQESYRRRQLIATTI